MSVQPFKLPSFAKLNWHLRVLGKRSDGFHELCTVFQTVSLADVISFAADDEFILTTDHPDIQTGETNLITRAARLLTELKGVSAGARIHLEKKIPAPGGLGGGSSNGAVALMGLARLWSVNVDKADLSEMAAKLGSDVPFFMHGGTSGASGRGTEFFPVPEIEEKHILIVAPRCDIPTGRAFEVLGRRDLTKTDAISILKICRNEALTLNLRESELVNDFEKVIFEIEPEIKRAKEKLLELEARKALMSGSGASVFAVFDSEELLQSAYNDLQIEDTWRKYIVRTISRMEYRESLKPVKEFIRD